MSHYPPTADTPHTGNHHLNNPGPSEQHETIPPSATQNRIPETTMGFRNPIHTSANKPDDLLGFHRVPADTLRTTASPHQRVTLHRRRRRELLTRIPRLYRRNITTVDATCLLGVVGFAPDTWPLSSVSRPCSSMYFLKPCEYDAFGVVRLPRDHATLRIQHATRRRHA